MFSQMDRCISTQMDRYECLNGYAMLYVNKSAGTPKTQRLRNIVSSIVTYRAVEMYFLQSVYGLANHSICKRACYRVPPVLPLLTLTVRGSWPREQEISESC
jgi:hypothetical protein